MLSPGGTQFGFCPAKAKWDPFYASVFRQLVIAAETGVMLEAGGLADQPEWWVDLLGWFVPTYRERMFASRWGSILPEVKSAFGSSGGGGGRKGGGGGGLRGRSITGGGLMPSQK